MHGVDVAAAVRASCLAVVGWQDSSGTPFARGVVPLVRGGRPVLAFTYAAEATARRIAAAERVSLVAADPRSTGKAFAPLVVHGRPRLVEDVSGDAFRADLLMQELRKHPPSRVLADSPLLQREHWWFLPRLLVEIDVDESAPFPTLSGPGEGLLLVGGRERIDVRPVEVADGFGAVADPPAGGPAVVLVQDASLPDLEQWEQWTYRGAWDGANLFVDEAPESAGLGRAPGLLARWRRQRHLERACREALSRAEPSP